MKWKRSVLTYAVSISDVLMASSEIADMDVDTVDAVSEEVI
jgi:hypothetical protein